MNARSRQVAADLARRALAAAERREAEAADAGLDTAALADRLRRYAEDDGRLTVDEVLVAIDDSGPKNPFAARLATARGGRQRRARERIFPSRRNNDRPTEDL